MPFVETNHLRFVLHRYWPVGAVLVCGIALTLGILQIESIHNATLKAPTLAIPMGGDAPWTIVTFGFTATVLVSLYLLQGIRASSRLGFINESLCSLKERLRISEEQFRLLFAESPRAKVIYDVARDCFLEANKSAEELFACSRDELLRFGLKRFYSIAQPDNSPVEESFAEHVKRALAGEVCRFERTLHIAGGRTRHCEVTLGRLPSSAVDKLLLAGFIDVTDQRVTENQLQFANTLLTAEMETSPDATLAVDEKDRIILTNRRFATMFGVPPHIIAGGDDALLLAAVSALIKDSEKFRQRVKYYYDNPNEAGCEELETIDGRFLIRHTAPLLAGDGRYLGRVWFFRDDTERKKSEQVLAESESKFRTILETAADGILVADLQSRKFVEGNPSIAKMLGYSQAELATLDLSDIHRPEDMPAVNEAFEKLTKGEIKIAIDIPVRRKNSSVFFADITTASLMLAGRECEVGFFRDATERLQNERIITHQAQHDSLTGLINRQFFLEKINEAIVRGVRGEQAFAVLCLNLDHFKDVNDSQGHPIGDELLRSVANRLRKCLGMTDAVARLGGDEFAVLLTFVGYPGEAGIRASKLIDAVSEPVTLKGNSVSITASIGISLYGTDADDAETLLAHADLAMHRAKAEGRNRYSFFTEEMDKEVRARVGLIGELKTAIKKDQLLVFYQPQIDNDTGAIIGVEGLVRWQHPKRGLLSPAEFIEVAESSGLIVDLGDWVLRDACRQARLWLDGGIALDSISIAINISPLQFDSPLELKANIERILSETGVPPTILELELTEMTLMAAGHAIYNVLTDLREMGIRIAIDDFGTGYSSLFYLIRYPVDRIKIAQEFMLKLTDDPSSMIIVKSTINLAHDLGLNIIAEGVENKEQLDLLKSWNCNQVQGYYYSRPLSAEAMTAHLLRGTMAPAGS